MHVAVAWDTAINSVISNKLQFGTHLPEATQQHYEFSHFSYIMWASPHHLLSASVLLWSVYSCFLYTISHTALVSLYKLMYFILIMCSKLRPSMMQHLLRRLVFDVPLLNEHTKMPLKVRNTSHLYLSDHRWIYRTFFVLLSWKVSVQMYCLFHLLNKCFVLHAFSW